MRITHSNFERQLY